MISVIVPVYNVENYLDNCVESIVNQTYKDLEIILVDDGSPDNCPAMCDEWAKKDSRIRVIHKENGGSSSARNAGLEAANGDYIAFVDSDDSIDVDMYQTMMELFSDEVDVVICGHQKINSSDSPEKCDIGNNTKTILMREELADEVFGKLNNSSCNKLYKKSALTYLEFPTDIQHGEDLIFNVKNLLNWSGGIICSCEFYHYYTREDSITRSSFNDKKFLEITSKDIAREIIVNEFPNQIINANKFCFRARMNIIRAIYSAKQSKNYYDKLSELTKYVKSNFNSVKNTLKTKEIIEYYLFVYFKAVYRFMIERK